MCGLQGGERSMWTMGGRWSDVPQERAAQDSASTFAQLGVKTDQKSNARGFSIVGPCRYQGNI